MCYKPGQITCSLHGALESLDKGKPWSIPCSTRWKDAEVERMRAECLLALALALSPPDPGEAERCYRRALQRAAGSGALLFELRAALGLYKLLASQCRKDEGMALLAPIHARFAEGFDLPLWREAQAILNPQPF